MSEEKKDNILTSVAEKVLGRDDEKNQPEEKEGDGKNLNQRIEDLVNEMEKRTKTVTRIFSLKFSFIRGLIQGLGIIIGSTVLAGALYSLTVELFGNDFLKDVVLDDVIEKYSQDK